VSAMIERDDHIPPFDELYKEFKCMREVGEEVLEKEAVV